MKSDSAVRRVAYCGIMAAAAMILSYVESLVPLPVPVPGIKLGLANMVTITAFYLIGHKSAWIISLLRICLSALLFGNFYSWCFSMAGGVCSLLFMTLALRTGWFSVTGISVTGGVMHNIGQIAAAAVMLKAALVIGYIPALVIAGIICGGVIGLLSYLLIVRIGKINFRGNF